MKIFLLLVLIFANYSAYATEPDIAPDATTSSCNSDVLNSDNGPVDIEINWEPNVIPLHWYSGNTLLPVENNDDTCTYDGVLNRPTNPTREGYNFAGWRVRPTMDFSTIPINQQGTEMWGKGWKNNANYCYYGHDESYSRAACDSDITFTELQPYEWKARFEHGDLYGMAGCSTGGAAYVGIIGNPTIENGIGSQCWCKATGYKPNNSDTIYGPSKTLSWVYENQRNSGVNCAQGCAITCLDRIVDSRDYFRKKLLIQ